MTDHTSSFVPCSFERLREFVWVGGCVTARAAWASPPRRRRRNSVHRLAKMVPRGRFRAFVYTVAPLWTGVGTQECTQIGENGPLEPFWGICVHCCDVSCVGWHERPNNRHGVPAALLASPPLPWSGKQALREWCRRQAGVFTGVSTHTNPRGAPKREGFLPYPCQGHPCPCHASCPSACAWTFWDLRPWPASSCPSSCSSRPTA